VDNRKCTSEAGRRALSLSLLVFFQLLRCWWQFQLLHSRGFDPKLQLDGPYIYPRRSETSRPLTRSMFRPVLFKTINFNPCYIKLFVFATFLMTTPADDSILWTLFFREPPTDCIRVEWLAQESLIFRERDTLSKLLRAIRLLSRGCDSWDAKLPRQSRNPPWSQLIYLIQKGCNLQWTSEKNRYSIVC
jgi:hypothetical protein